MFPSCNGIGYAFPFQKEGIRGTARKNWTNTRKAETQATNPVVPHLVSGALVAKGLVSGCTPGFAVLKMHLSFGLVLLIVCSSEAERRVCGRIGGRALKPGQKERARVLDTNEEQTKGSRTVVVFTAGEGVCNMLCLLAESLAQSLLITVT